MQSCEPNPGYDEFDPREEPVPQVPVPTRTEKEEAIAASMIELLTGNTPHSDEVIDHLFRQGYKGFVNMTDEEVDAEYAQLVVNV